MLSFIFFKKLFSFLCNVDFTRVKKITIEGTSTRKRPKLKSNIIFIESTPRCCPRPSFELNTYSPSPKTYDDENVLAIFLIGAQLVWY